MPDPVITFLTDYGLADPFVGVCHGVIARRCPRARIIDLCHGIPPQDVRAGATALARAVPFLPPGVLLGVVDPGVGGARRGVALRAADGRLLVGPDNGLLGPAARAAGGVAAAVDLAGSPFALSPVSATFHGRDVFAPVAAALADGARLEEAGAAIDPASLVALDDPRPRVADGALVARVAAVDRFGNLELGAGLADLGAAGLAGRERLVVEVGDEAIPVAVGRIFSDVDPGESLLYEDSGGALSLAVSHGSAADRFGVGAGDELRIGAA
ncbi:MAG TPA: SAM-dependent chlorinase/fluorinase [Solirubrobacteraceae bacterium]|nr:SAM-dependent chlorinase/fluorinase [Solirubrobacteraceae bacterium]